MGNDLRYALRAVWRSKGFFAFAALIIGLGIGANTAVFSVLSPLLLRPLPFEEPERLVWVAHGTSGGMSSVTSRTSNLRDYRELSETLDALTGYMAFFEYESYNLVGEGEPERLVGVGVAHDFLEVLGVRPLLGRNFVEEESVDNGRPAAILTHRFWSRRFGADPDVVGRSISLNGQPTAVVGVLPPTFDFTSTFVPGSRVDFLKPFPISDATDQWGNTMAMIGRLAPGATVESAQAELDLLTDQLQAANPERWGLGAVVSRLRDHVAGGVKSSLVLLAAAAAAVMLIACANLSNLLLVRSVRRHREMAVRSVLGAGRLRLFRQLLAESLLLSMGGAVIGIVIAAIATRAVAATTAVTIPMLSSVSIDLWAVGFTVGLAALAGLLVALVPALKISPGREAAVINDASRGSNESRRSGWVRELLVIAEVALACVLLVGGGLLVRSFLSVLDVDLGFRAQEAMAWRVDTKKDFANRSERVAFYDQLVARVEAIPGVESVGLTDTLPLGRNRGWDLRVKGVYYEDGGPGAFPRMIDHGYLQSMRIPLLEGRDFTPDDTADTQQVIILNESASRELFPGGDALGQTVLTGGPDAEWQVVGIVADVRHQSLEQDSGLEMYMPISQQGWGTLDMVVRSSMAPEALVGSVQEALRATDPAMPTGDYRTLEQIVDRSVSPRRFILWLLGAFAATALLLAALGIYGVLSYSVAQRAPEIGIRMALGASASGVQRSVVGRAVTLAAIGVAIGSLGSLLVSRLLASQLYGVGSADLQTFVVMATILLMVSALAGYLPARRASRTDPNSALRAD